MSKDDREREPAELIYDWNAADGLPGIHSGEVTLDDETLRDGLQSPSVVDPPVEDKAALLHLMNDLGIHTVELGLPAAGPRAYADTLALVREIADSGLSLHPSAAARTVIADIEPIVEISQKTGVPVETALFVAASPIRLLAENWELSRLLDLVERAVTFAVDHDLPVMFVTEDTTRATPEAIKALYQTAIRCGARRITVADTAGHATPTGVRAVMTYVREIAEQTGEDVFLDWHGHNDRGLATINALTAVLSGADQVHATALGIGERSGNAAMDQVLVNLKLMDIVPNDISSLDAYCRAAARAFHVNVPVNYPVVGRDAFRTATGIHAAAAIKTARFQDHRLEELITSAVPASWVGREAVLEIGPLSGTAGVAEWLRSHGYDPTPPLVERVFQAAKKAQAVLSAEEIAALAREAGAEPVPSSVPPRRDR